MRLTITQEHIDTAFALRNSLQWHNADYNCPVALALQAVGFPKAWVGAFSLKTKPRASKTPHSKALKAYINKYDVKRKAVPRTFILKGISEAA